jgi:predicted phosphodiesterase
MKLMRIGLVSDVHSNIAALRNVLDSLQEKSIRTTVCLGDTVGYNAHPNECIEELAKRKVHMVLGNHDWAATTGEPKGFNPIAVAGVEHARKVLTPENRQRIQQWPRSFALEVDGRLLRAYHGSPRDPLMEYVFPRSPEPMWADLAKTAGSPWAIALGHTHLPMNRRSGETLFVNPGSVGQPRDGDPRASFGILDTETDNFEIVRVAYDVESTAAANKAVGLPELSWQRLFRGV